MTARSPFLRPDSAGLADTLTDAVVELIRIGGVRAVTTGGVARRLGVTPSAVSHRFEGGGTTARQRVVQLATVCFADRWLSWSASSPRDQSFPLCLPDDEEARFGVHAWHAFHELAREHVLEGHTDPSEALAEAAVQEAAVIRLWLGGRDPFGAPLAGGPVVSSAVPTTETAGLLALTTGLRWHLAVGVIDLGAAVGQLDRAVAGLLAAVDEPSVGRSGG